MAETWQHWGISCCTRGLQYNQRWIRWGTTSIIRCSSILLICWCRLMITGVTPMYYGYGKTRRTGVCDNRSKSCYSVVRMRWISFKKNLYILNIFLLTFRRESSIHDQHRDLYVFYWHRLLAVATTRRFISWSDTVSNWILFLRLMCAQISSWKFILWFV